MSGEGEPGLQTHEESGEQKARKKGVLYECLRSVSCHLAIPADQCSASSLPASNKLYT